jgi:hypothetical protein
MKNYTDMHLDLSKKSGAKIFPGATRGSARGVPKIQQGQIQPNWPTFDRENYADSECKYLLAFTDRFCSKNPINAGNYRKKGTFH